MGTLSRKTLTAELMIVLILWNSTTDPFANVAILVIACIADPDGFRNVTTADARKTALEFNHERKIH